METGTDNVSLDFSVSGGGDFVEIGGDEADREDTEP